MSFLRRILLLAIIALVLVWVTLAMVVYGDLPATLATHFGPDGRADQFSEKSIGSWFVLTIIGVCTTAFLLVTAQRADSRPEMFNIPGKAALLSLPRDLQAPFLEELATWMTGLSLVVIVQFAAIQYDMWRVATSSQRGLSLVSWSAMGIGFGGFMLGTIVWMVYFRRAVVAAAAVAVARAPSTGRRTS